MVERRGGGPGRLSAKDQARPEGGVLQQRRPARPARQATEAWASAVAAPSPARPILQAAPSRLVSTLPAPPAIALAIPARLPHAQPHRHWSSPRRSHPFYSAPSPSLLPDAATVWQLETSRRLEHLAPSTSHWRPGSRQAGGAPREGPTRSWKGPSEASLLSQSVVSTYPPREMDLFLLSGIQCMKPCHVGKGGWRPPELLKTNADVIVRVSRSIEGHVKVPHESSFSTINANLHFPPIHKILYVDSPGTILRNLASLCLLAICENRCKSVVKLPDAPPEIVLLSSALFSDPPKTRKGKRFFADPQQ
jgi:hypothetical protein